AFVHSRKVSPLLLATGALFLLCFATVIADLVRAWLNIPDAAHGILIAPVAIWLAWRTGVLPERRPERWAGSALVVFAVMASVLGRVAGIETVPRAALLLALAGLTLWYGGWRQLLAWWLPGLLLALTIPLPESLIAALTLPLQAVAAKMGAALLASRHIPVLLSGSVIRLPGHTLFVSEACSGLRSLTALLSMAILVGALFLRYPLSRIFMVGMAVGLAIVVNGIRIFMTGFLVFFVDPKLGDGFMHITEGYLLFLFSLTILAVLTWGFANVEGRVQNRGREIA
ncbi:MAG: exosortase/archaeosortase family protein, partial [Gemmatimonadaceae bacterium]